MDNQSSFWPLYPHDSPITPADDNSLMALQGSRCHVTQPQEPTWADLFPSMGSVDASNDMSDCVDLNRTGEFAVRMPASFDNRDRERCIDSMSAANSFSTPISYETPTMSQNHVQPWQTVNVPTASYPPCRFDTDHSFSGRNHYLEMPQGLLDNRGLGIDLDPTSITSERFHNLPYPPSMGTNQSFALDDDRITDPGNIWSQNDVEMDSSDRGLIDENGEEDSAGSAADPCYAKLLYRCLMETPNHTLALKDIYDWIGSHSQKAKDPKNNGWRNSVRHNLSMNAVGQISEI